MNIPWFLIPFFALSPIIVIAMLVMLFVWAWNPEVIRKHERGGISIRWTRAIVGATLALVVTLIVVLPRL